MHTLYDDCRVLPDPSEMIGATLIEGEEIERLKQLGRIFGPLIEELGDAPDARYLDDPRWEGVVRLAGLALAAIARTWRSRCQAVSTSHRRLDEAGRAE